MADEKNLEAAREVFDTLCAMLDHLEYSYHTDEKNLQILCTVVGDDLPMSIRIDIMPELEIISLQSPLPIEVPEDKSTDVALAISAVNWDIVDGNFDYDILGGDILFRMTSSYRDSIIGEDLLKYMLLTSCNTIDEYNDRLVMLVIGKMSLESFLDSIFED